MQKRIARRTISTVPQLPGLSPLMQRIYAARKIQSLDDIDYRLAQLLPYHTLTDIDKAAKRLAQAISNQEKIIIVGDFDTDGATSTALAVSALRALGATHVDFLVPNRFIHGYGLTPAIVKLASEKLPNVIVTVDNGVASVEGVALANELHIDVIVTDHHLPGRVLPDAYAIVNPNQKNDLFPSKMLAGVGVIFYVMLALRQALSATVNMAQFLDLVALGTVADVVPLDKNNRILVQQGLQRIRNGYARPGIAALLKVASRDHQKIVAMDLGFSVGPRLNAAGRLDDMSLGILCLLSETSEAAETFAKKLNQLNIERREIEAEMKLQAFDIVDHMKLQNNMQLGVCLYDPAWHQGVIGLVSSRVKEKINRPVIAFAKGDAGFLKGSARSVKNVHIRDVLDEIATAHPSVLSKFGGHAMAAGLTIAEKDFSIFKKLFSEVVSKYLSADQLDFILETDGELSHTEFTLDNAILLKEAGPWGQHFPEPVFDGEFEIVSQRLVGDQHLKLSLKPKDGQFPIDAIAFGVDTARWPNHRCTHVQLTYRLDVNAYQGRRSLQLVVDEFVTAQENVFVL